MLTSAQIRKQLVEALEINVIGPGPDHLARSRETTNPAAILSSEMSDAITAALWPLAEQYSRRYCRASRRGGKPLSQRKET